MSVIIKFHIYIYIYITFLQLWPVVRKALGSKEEKEQREAIGETHEHLETLESELKEKKFFGGESRGYLDIAAMVIIWLGIAQEALGVEFIPKEKFPRLHEWQQRLVEDAVFKECVPPREKLGAFFKARFGSSAASKWRVGLCLSNKWMGRWYDPERITLISSHICTLYLLFLVYFEALFWTLCCFLE